MLETILEQRAGRYGEFKEHATITQAIKNCMKNSKNWGTLSADKMESLEMISHKIGRILNGDPEYADSWIDIAGYAKLISDKLEKGTK